MTQQGGFLGETGVGSERVAAELSLCLDQSALKNAARSAFSRAVSPM